MSHKFKLGCAAVGIAILSAAIGLWFGWKLIASDSCYDAGGIWSDAGGVCLGLQTMN